MRTDRERSAGLVQACEELCDRLRAAVGLTTFRIVLMRADPPLVITLRGPDDQLYYAPRHDWMRPAVPARLEMHLDDGGRRLADVLIEDARRGAYTEDDRSRAEGVLGGSADLVEQLTGGPPSKVARSAGADR